MPSHLDRFEAAFVGFGWVVGETGELGDHLVQIGEADGQRVSVGELFLKLNADLFGVGPENFAGHRSSPRFELCLFPPLTEKLSRMGHPDFLGWIKADPSLRSG